MFVRTLASYILPAPPHGRGPQTVQALVTLLDGWRALSHLRGADKKMPGDVRCRRA